MLKIKNKIPSALTIGGKIVERIKMRNEVVWEKVQLDYFYIESLTDGNTVTLITNLRNTSYSSYLTPTIEYSTDKQNWTTITFDWSTYDVKNINIPVVLNTGDKMYFRNDTGKFSRAIYDGSSYDTPYITFTTDWQGRVNVGGDIRTLINYRNVDNTILEDGMFSNLFSHTYDSNHNTARIVDASNLILPFTQMTPYCYYDMFNGCTPLVNAPALPATTLAWSCYQFMFRGCTSLTTAPELPATILASSCYYGMFNDCTSLTTAPTLPATTLESNCYQFMFWGCTSLTSAPELPATTLAYYCYQYMFSDCTSLTTAPTLPATTLEFNCYYSMFSGCTSLTTAPALPATTLVSDCYSSMFDGCSNLNKVLTYADDISTSDCTTNWLNNVAATGTFYNVGSAVYTTDSPSGIPTGWTEVTTVPTTTSVYALPNTFTAKSWMYEVKLNYTIIGVNETGIDVPLGEQNELITIGKNTGSSTVTHTETLTYDGMDYTITINQTANDTDEPDYFYIESLGDGNTVSVINKGNGNTDNVTPTLEYSTDKNTWDTITFDWARGEHTTELPIALNTGEKMYFRNDTRKFSNSSYKYISFSSSVSSNVGGDIRTLSNYLDVNSETKPQTNMFCSLFYNNKNIVDASNLRLPYTTLASNCYYNMFYGCSSLTTAPTLPATTLANSCYQSMFENCTSLVNAPQLPATTLASGCYYNMFSGCSSLTAALELPATTLAGQCYQYMFYGCTSLTTAPALPATTLAPNCYRSMFKGCGLTTVPELPATTLAESCYNSMFDGCTSLTVAPALPATTLAESCYNFMFIDCTSLTTAPELPATTLEGYCYSSMFSGCTSLTTAPELPATTLTSSCYGSMFKGCGLTTAPELPATTLADSCYSSMFRNCGSLTTAPELPATTLAEWCYNSMFENCTSLTTAPTELPATTLESNCYNSMFSGCTSLTTVPTLPATTLASRCYSSMFNGCNSLTSVTIYATSTANNSFDSWLNNVALSGTVYNNGLVSLPKNSASGVPSGWTEIVPEIQSITVNPDTFTIEFNNETVTCNSTLEVVTTMGTFTNTNSVTLTVGENTGNTTRTLKETIPYYNSSYDVTIVQSAIQSITANPDTFTIKSYKDTAKCTSTLTITTTLGTTVTDTNSATFTVGENTGDTTRTLTETIPYKGSSYQVTIVQTANDVKPAYSWNVESTGTYPFELNTNGYYESTNKGQRNSYSYATLNYEGFENLVLECINSGESNYDYGIISQPDVQLGESISDDGATGSTNVFHNFKGQSSTNPVQLTIPSDKGSHFITIKFRKDVSGDEGNDSLQFKVIEP